MPKAGGRLTLPGGPTAFGGAPWAPNSLARRSLELVKNNKKQKKKQQLSDEGMSKATEMRGVAIKPCWPNPGTLQVFLPTHHGSGGLAWGGTNLRGDGKVSPPGGPTRVPPSSLPNSPRRGEGRRGGRGGYHQKRPESSGMHPGTVRNSRPASPWGGAGPAARSS